MNQEQTALWNTAWEVGYDAGRQAAKHEWVGLTEKDIYEIIETNIPPKLTSLFDMAEWVSKIIEVKLKEKNT